MKMKREYKKPVVELVRFELNVAIAACDAKIYKTPMNGDINCVLNEVFRDINFYEQENSCSDDRWPEKYCYYTPEGIATFNS